VGRRRLQSALVGLAIGVVLADSSVVTLALPDILARFDVEVPTVAWVLTSFNLLLALTAVPAAYVARIRPKAAFAAGTVVFAGASILCALAPAFGVLVAGRCVQAVGGALVVCAALDLLFATLGSDAGAAATWAAAGVLGAALGPAIGGVLTQLAGWQAIFVAQAPLALATLAALAGLGAVAEVPGAAGRPHLAANAALLLVSGALAAALFLLVILLVNGWRLEPAVAGLVVTVMPAAAIVAARLAPRVGGAVVRAATGAILIGGGLAALAFLPHAGVAWTVPPQILVGAGLGLALSALTERALAGRSPQAVHGGWTIASRHAGVVLGLLLLTPIFTASLDRNQDEALAAATAAVVDSRVPPLDKLRLAQDVLTEVDRAEGRVPDVAPAFAERVNGESGDEYKGLWAEIEDQLDRAATNAFSSSFLVSSLLALAALLPIGLSRGEVGV
jgi:predicted MFS family arabinose efflux permease